MFESLDVGRASSYVVLLVAVVLIAGLLLEYARITPNASRIGASVAGSIFVGYAVCATVYLLLRTDAGAPE